MKVNWLQTCVDGPPAIDQGSLGGYQISYNPDDERWYVHAGEDTVHHFKGNARGHAALKAWIKAHPLGSSTKPVRSIWRGSEVVA